MHWRIKLLGPWFVLFLTIAFLQRRRPNFYRRYAFRYSRLFTSNVDEKVEAARRSLLKATDLARLNPTSADLLVTIVTTYRFNVRHQYFHLTLWTLLNELRNNAELRTKAATRSSASLPPPVRLRILVCHTRSNGSWAAPDYLFYLRGRLPVVRRHAFETNKFDTERADYVFCLNQSLHAMADGARHLLMLEDDVIPRRHGAAFLPTLRHAIAKAEQGGSRRFAYIKLYHPPRLLGYLQPEWDRHLEAAAIAALLLSAARLLAAVLSRRCVGLARAIDRGPVTIFLLLLLILYSLDRYWVLELRELSKHSHVLVATTFCCTPGIVFQRQGALEALRFMSGVRCHSKYRKDYALFDFYRRSGLRAWQVQPNLLEHVGRKSNLHSENIDTWGL